MNQTEHSASNEGLIAEQFRHGSRRQMKIGACEILLFKGT